VSSGGTTTSGGTTGTGGSCGNGTVGPGEQCDLGVNNAASPAFWVTQSGQSFAVVPVIRSASAPNFYNYSSASAHTGFEEAYASRILLYLDKSTRALSLVVFHGVDIDTTGEKQPTSHVQMLFSGLPSTTTVGVSDDSDEFLMTSPTTATGFWKFSENSDGGALSGLPFPGDWEITIAPSFMDGISTWTWVQRDGSMVHLDLTQPLTIKAHSSPSPCRLDCTTPRCGDGILDGGEICDDGSQPVDGCASDCMSFW
jgi:cysteine-rich repeat protein